MKFLQSLNESKLFTSNTAYRKYHAQSICELTVLHFCALRILFNDVRTHKWAIEYALKSNKILQFARFYTSTTDTALLMYACLNPSEVEFRNDDDSQFHMEGVSPDVSTITQWVRNMSQGRNNESLTRRLFTNLDHQFAITNTTIRSIRRLVLDWPHLTNHEHKLAMTRLLQILRAKANRSDMLDKLQAYADDIGLEIKDADNPSEPKHHEEPKKKKKKSGWLGHAVAGALGYGAARKFLEAELEEEASAGATSAASIAPCVMPFGATQRRKRSS